MTAPLQRGARYATGYFNARGRLVLVREDGSTATQPVILIRGQLVDHGDGTYDILPHHLGVTDA